jgi:hypothetical protein
LQGKNSFPVSLLHERDLRGVRIDENGRDCAGRPRGLAKRIKLGSENTQKLFGNVDDVFRIPSLLEFLKDRHSGSGRLWPLSVDHYGDRLSQVAQKAEIQPWPHNALRHSFGSYFYALTKNENTVAAEMGNSHRWSFVTTEPLSQPIARPSGQFGLRKGHDRKA